MKVPTIITEQELAHLRKYWGQYFFWKREVERTIAKAAFANYPMDHMLTKKA